jgi:Flp pilus assembly protein protease CpaA
LNSPCIEVYLSVEAIMNYLWSYLQVVISLVVFLVILGWIIRVCAQDARRRGKSPVLVTLLVVISFPLDCLYGSYSVPSPWMAEARASVWKTT